MWRRPHTNCKMQRLRQRKSGRPDESNNTRNSSNDLKTLSTVTTCSRTGTKSNLKNRYTSFAHPVTWAGNRRSRDHWPSSAGFRITPSGPFQRSYEWRHPTGQGDVQVQVHNWRMVGKGYWREQLLTNRVRWDCRETDSMWAHPSLHKDGDLLPDIARS